MGRVSASLGAAFAKQRCHPMPAMWGTPIVPERSAGQPPENGGDCRLPAGATGDRYAPYESGPS